MRGAERDRAMLACEQMGAQVEALTAELDNAHTAIGSMTETSEIIQALLDREVWRGSALRALLREAAGVLRPLADQADETGDLPDGAVLAYPAEVCLVAGDLRRARAVIAKMEAL